MDLGPQEEIKRKVQGALKEAASLPPGNEEHAIHEIRKCIKSARALLRLLGPEYRPSADALAEVGRKLSKFRDAEALLETFDQVVEDYREQLPATEVASIREGLVMRKEELQRGAGAGAVVPVAARALRRIARQVAAQPMASTPVSKVFDDSFRRSEKAFEKAKRRPGPETLHDWRKRVKEQFYQLQLLEKSSRIEKLIERLRDVASWLGDDHNLAVLRDTIFEQPTFYGSLPHVDLFLDCAAAHERKLRKKALALGPKLYKRAAKRRTFKFARQIAA